MTQITRKDALELKSRLDEFHLNSEIELCAPWGVADVEQIERHHRFIENDPLLWPMLYPRTQCKALAFDLGGAIIKRFFPAVSIGDRYEYYLMCRLIDAGIPQIQLDAHAIKHTPLRTTFLWRGARAVRRFVVYDETPLSLWAQPFVSARPFHQFHLSIILSNISS